MSRGHGRTQREILSLLIRVNGPATIEEMASIIYRDPLEPTKSHLNVIGRALRKLEAERFVQRHGVNKRGLETWRFIGVNVDRTPERQQKLAAEYRLAGKPKLVRG